METRMLTQLQELQNGYHCESKQTLYCYEEFMYYLYLSLIPNRYPVFQPCLKARA